MGGDTRPHLMTAPFPWPGGKRRWAPIVWRHFGYVDTYLEPFAGSLAILLANPKPCAREIVADTDGLLCNFWRALRHDPLQVAWYADWPTVHQDLTARHKWLVNWAREHSPKLMDDPCYYDCKAAGWWVWGCSNWIGGGWCASTKAKDGADWIPHASKFRGQGIQAQRAEIPHIKEKVPAMHNADGIGVRQGRQEVPDGVPKVSTFPGSRGVTAQREAYPLTGPPNGQRLLGWFNQLAARLAKVVVLNRPWTSFTSDSLLMQCKGSPKGVKVGIVLDPPYKTDGRSTGLYAGDRAGASDDAATSAYEWAVEHGERFRIAYFSHAGDFPVPEGWTTDTMSLSAIKRKDRQHRQDQVMFSPCCEKTVQLSMFD